MKIRLLTVLVTTILAAPVSADTTYYVGGNVSFLKYGFQEHSTVGLYNCPNPRPGLVSQCPLDFFTTTHTRNHDLTSLGVRLGAQFHPNFSAEFRFGFGLDDDDEPTIYGGLNSKYEVGLEIYYGGYVRAGTEIGRFYPYLLAGWTAVTVETKSYDDIRSSFNLPTDFSYGIGTDIRINDAWAVNAEWEQYIETANIELSGFRMGLVYSF
ncbi:MAG: porin family protein [Gammaproteobacteria bacterium]|nr:porin family protein [Gammaproteobacteria bacterium]